MTYGLTRICSRAILLACITFAACAAPYPHVGYYELDDAIASAETQEEADYYRHRLDVFEDQADKAVLFYEMKHSCLTNSDRNGETVWFCRDHTPRNTHRRPFKDIEDTVKTYRREHLSCWCSYVSK